MTTLTEFYPKDPISLTLTSDFRLCLVDPLYDFVWELLLGRGEPAGVSLYSTFGLRAKEFKMFPRFTEADVTIFDPSDFQQPVIITTLYPSMIRLEFSPLLGINVKMMICVPNSFSLSIQIEIHNSRLNHRNIGLDWVSMLSPGSDGHRMKQFEDASIQYLLGQSESIYPMTFMNGVTDFASGSLPSITKQLTLPAGSTEAVQIYFSAHGTTETTIEKIKSLREMDWNLEYAKIENTNQTYINLKTNDEHLDKLLYSGQVSAIQHMIRLDDSSTGIRSVENRSSYRIQTPDQTKTNRFSTPLLSPWENYYLSTILLPIQPDFIANILQSYMEIQESSGRIEVPITPQDPNRTHHATPMLGTIALDYYHHTKDRQFLQDIYPKLLDYFNHWFDQSNDPDEDGIPNFRSPIQFGLDNHPLFIPHQTLNTPIDIHKIESPALCSLLYQDGRKLVEIAKILENSSPITAITTRSEHMRAAVISSWSAESQSFHYWDIDSHDSPAGEIIAEITGPGEYSLVTDISQPTRIGIRIIPKETKPIDYRIFLHGTNRADADRIEKITNAEFVWQASQGITITEVIFASITEVEIYDIQDFDVVQLFVPDYRFEDISLLSSIAVYGDDSQQVFNDTITNTVLSTEKFLGNRGIKTYLMDQTGNLGSIVEQGINIPWNQYLGELLVDYGYRNQTWDLISRIIKAMDQSVSSSHTFYSYYHHETGEALGPRGSIVGLPPLHLFLKVIGIEYLSRAEIVLNGYNPAPDDVIIEYMGITITASKGKYTIKFPGGQTIVVRDPKMQVIKLDYSGSTY